ncbi:OmpP1/FadL family transporter [Spirosoma rhododendri]|uniref:OmpP1/FadL family transporter n=1 Tax=Spirosoma rhododendri TaxID=2728024 RepID=UPI00158173F0|nr:outer membrane protein transport protein [Spirosoma rhododendri]
MLKLYTRVVRLIGSSILAVTLVSSLAHGQGLGNTPYSALGLGEAYPLGNAANIGMGGLGISNPNPFYLNLQNPALLATRPPVTVFEVGLQGLSRSLTQRISNSTQSQQNFGANLGYLAVAFPANPRWSMSVSLRPFTYVNYSTVQVQQVPGTNRSGVYDYKGSGGLNKASFATGFRLFEKKNVYVGGEASFLFGNITNSSAAYVALNGNGTDTQVNLLNRVNYGDVVFKLGAAWRPKLSENWTLNLGATYDPETRIKGTQTDIYQLTQSSSPITTPDTARNNVTGKTTLPQQVHAGISIERNNRFTAGVDVGYQQWSRFRNNDNVSTGLLDAITTAVGFELTPKSNSTRYRDLITYRLGAQYNQMPYEIGGTRINDMNVSTGVSLPLGRYRVNQVTLSLVYGQRGVLAGMQVREQYLRMALGFSLADRWFVKRVID